MVNSGWRLEELSGMDLNELLFWMTEQNKINKEMTREAEKNG
jgi:hypothetical protein|nr:MAG TPA: hypothetical protein [Caudoviricetes sp.]